MNPAPARYASGLFGVCSLLCCALAVPAFDGADADEATLLVALIGQAFSEHTTRNIDFGVSATITVGSTATLLAILLWFRFGFARLILVGLGTLTALYYLYASARLAEAGAPAAFYLWPLIALALWTAATLVAALPVTGRAMRGHSASQPYHPVPPY
ncbi:hypothetical protein ABZV91_12030 [Nocardia sp. NPDC004568]|uniref:hypothetical protein n=1 Tax=Nocardia sp. NPDC004568 TaxID=3154551 RepID=UPI0033B511CF